MYMHTFAFGLVICISCKNDEKRDEKRETCMKKKLKSKTKLKSRYNTVMLISNNGD